MLAVSSERGTLRVFLAGNAGGGVSASLRPTGRGSSPPKSVDGAMQRLDGGYDTFVDEKRASVSCVLFLH